MTINDAVQRWQVYSNMIQELVDACENDIQNNNVGSTLEAICLCNLHAIIISAASISEQALNIVQIIAGNHKEDKKHE